MPLCSGKAVGRSHEQKKASLSHHNTGPIGVSRMTTETTTTPFGWQERCQEANRKPNPAGEGQKRQTQHGWDSIPTRLAMAPMKSRCPLIAQIWEASHGPER